MIHKRQDRGAIEQQALALTGVGHIAKLVRGNAQLLGENLTVSACLVEHIAEVSRIIKRLYEDNVNGKISDERFMELSADYEAEQAELKKRAAALQAELDKSQAATVNAEKFMGIVRKHLAFEELTPTLLREMVEKIVVHECSYDENGTRRQDIEIYYSFVGKIDLPE